MYFVLTKLTLSCVFLQNNMLVLVGLS